MQIVSNAFSKVFYVTNQFAYQIVEDIQDELTKTPKQLKDSNIVNSTENEIFIIESTRSSEFFQILSF